MRIRKKPDRKVQESQVPGIVAPSLLAWSDHGIGAQLSLPLETTVLIKNHQRTRCMEVRA